MEKEQDKDPVISIVKELVRNKTNPETDVNKYGKQVSNLWDYAATLTIEKGILYRKFI